MPGYRSKRDLDNGGFTMIELLVAVVVIGVISTITYTVMNTTRQREIASDGVARSNIQKVVEGIESYRAVEGVCPTASNDPLLATYIDNWPDDSPSGAVYTYAVNAARTECGVAVPISQGITLKYRTEWSAISECDDSDPGSLACTSTAKESCGDGICNGIETCASCPGDCTSDCTGTPSCGDGVCNGVETCATCPEDCTSGCTIPPICGDGACNGTETCVSCPSDCKVCTGPVCGNGTCDAGETCASCVSDCCAADSCGDGTCNGSETCLSCPTDCICKPICGDGTCDVTEDCLACPSDCKICAGGWCGNGVCETGETCDSCPEDCTLCWGTGKCGDGVCDFGENCVSCPGDCLCMD